MRIRAIELENVRRFTDPTRVDNITDGLNILSEPNEHGKSTLFDALQAVFFKPHKSKDQAIRSLAPHFGGWPEVSVDLENADGLFRITKRWISKPIARVEKAGQLIAQADEAEAWISNLLGSNDGGPSGLLWVQQGLTALSNGSGKEKDAAFEVRQDLLSSVTGEVAAMTGGRRMDSALARCREELASFRTKSGQAKAGGPWKTAIDEVNRLTELKERLANSVSDLNTALEKRRELRAKLAGFQEPEEKERRKSRLDEAEKIFVEAEKLGNELERDAERVLNLEIRANAAKRNFDDFCEAEDEMKDATSAVTEIKNKREKGSGAVLDAEKNFESLKKVMEQARREMNAAEKLLQKAYHHRRATDGAARKAELADRLKKAIELRSELEELAPATKQGPDRGALSKLEELERKARTARAVRDSKAAQLTINYESGSDGTVKLDGVSVQGGVSYPLADTAEIKITGVGTLSFHGETKDEVDTSVEVANADLLQELNRFDCATMEEVRSAAEARQKAEAGLAAGKDRLSMLAPDGIAKLREELTAIPDAEERDEEVPEPDTAELARDAAAGALSEALGNCDAAREAFSRVREEAAILENALEGANGRVDRVVKALEKFGETDRASLAEQVQAASTSHAQAAATLEKKKADAPNLQMVKASRDRAKSIVDTANTEINRLIPEIAILDAKIVQIAGEDAVEEKLVETTELLATAERNKAIVEHEIAVLSKLEEVLDTAKTSARERYFEPIAEELRPLLSLLWPEATLVWGDETLLPSALIRNGVEEEINILSGGTQEQVALLVRLAFARMLAKSGRDAPVILDDALVFTDDDRIEKMFDALHSQASDLQLIVFSCRQRAFRDLGGNPLHLSKVS